MLVIRLQRVGKKKQAAFRVVLQEKTWASQGKAKELLGFYNPIQKEKKFQEERVKYWISKGAHPSPTVHNLLVDAGLLEGPKMQAWTPKRKPASPETKQAEPKAGAAAPTEPETNAEEKTAPAEAKVEGEVEVEKETPAEEKAPEPQEVPESQAENK